jgi:hypothetical protein
MSASLDDLMGNALTEPIADMSDDDSEIEVSIVDDRPEDDQVSPRDPDRGVSFDGDAEIENLGGRAGKRIKQLRYEFHEQRRAKEEADRMRTEAVNYARQMTEQNGELRGLLQRGEKVLISEMDSRTEEQLNRARGTFKGAYEEGDSDAILSAQEDLNRAQSEREMAKSYRPSIDETMPPQPMPQQAPQPQRTVDPKLQGWLQQNGWFGRDEEMTSFAYGVHEKLVSRHGVDPKSDDYYKLINDRMREVFPDRFSESMGNEEPAANSRRSTVVAPARRSAGTPRKVQLTSTQVALAKRLGLQPEQYANQLLMEDQNG